MKKIGTSLLFLSALLLTSCLSNNGHAGSRFNLISSLFENADKSESQDICFVPDGDYAGFIARTTGNDCPPGDFVLEDGTVVGRHKGVTHYTIGQRRGLGLGEVRILLADDRQRARGGLVEQLLELRHAALAR